MMKLASSVQWSHSLPSSRWKRKQRKKISTFRRALPVMSEKYPASQQPSFHSYAHWTWFSEKGPFMFIVQIDWSDLLHTRLILFPPSVSQWLHPSLRSSGHCPTSRAPMSCGSKCSPSHTTGPTMRRKAAEGPSKPQPVATLWFRYGLEFFLFCVPDFFTRWLTSAKPLPVAF